MTHPQEPLATYVELISDDFQSTFTVRDKNTLINCLGLPGDFENLTKIIRKYIPDAEVKYTKLESLNDDGYGVYSIEVFNP